MPRWFYWLVIIGTIVIVVSVISNYYPRPQSPVLGWGATFSPAYATYLGLNWQEVFTAAQTDLGITKWRIPVQWNDVELQPDNYDFSQLDWLLQQAESKNNQVILAIGRRTPRWPECHDPAWLQFLTKDQQNERVLSFVSVLVQRYRDSKVITAWQVENEMNLEIFGKCPSTNMELFKKEVGLVRALDSSRRIITTASGELSRWGTLVKLVDELGVSLYRLTYNQWWGYFSYPYPAWFYKLRAALVQRQLNKPIFISELQMEPWGRLALGDLPVAEQLKTMSVKQGQLTLKVAKQTGLSPVYLWGVEWWYWLKVKHQYPDWWELMKNTINSSSL